MLPKTRSQTISLLVQNVNNLLNSSDFLVYKIFTFTEQTTHVLTGAPVFSCILLLSSVSTTISQQFFLVTSRNTTQHPSQPQFQLYNKTLVTIAWLLGIP